MLSVHGFIAAKRDREGNPHGCGKDRSGDSIGISEVRIDQVERMGSRQRMQHWQQPRRKPARIQHAACRWIDPPRVQNGDRSHLPRGWNLSEFCPFSKPLSVLEYGNWGNHAHLSEPRERFQPSRYKDPVRRLRGPGKHCAETQYAQGHIVLPATLGKVRHLGR